MARVIVTTPENWDIFTKKPENSAHTQLVRLVIIDDVLLLQGHVLEAIVARMQISTGCEADIRLVGLSPALQNSADVARFLKVVRVYLPLQTSCATYRLQRKTFPING